MRDSYPGTPTARIARLLHGFGCFIGGASSASLAAETCLAGVISPKQWGQSFGWLNHSPRSAGERAMTAQTAIAAMAGCLAQGLHAWRAPWPATGTVPVLDMVELRSLGAYLLFRAQCLLAPSRERNHASREREGSVDGVGAAAGGGDRSLWAHLVIGRTEVCHGFSTRLGWWPAARSPLGCAGRDRFDDTSAMGWSQITAPAGLRERLASWTVPPP